MVNALLEGILLGFALSILIGPAFFALIQTSIEKGFESGIAFALGIFLSDTLCVFLAYLGASQLFDNPESTVVVGIVGGIITILFGVGNLLRKKINTGDTMEIKQTEYYLLTIKGFLLNLVNPFAILFWIGSVAMVSSKLEFKTINFITYFSGTLFTVFATDILKAYLALKIKNVLKPQLMLTVNRVAGIILIIFGAILIYRVAF